MGSGALPLAKATRSSERTSAVPSVASTIAVDARAGAGSSLKEVRRRVVGTGVRRSRRCAREEIKPIERLGPVS